MEILRIEGLCKRYPEFQLKDVSFSMREGTIMGFIGRNGAGKTTTLKALLHLVHPDAGSVTLFGMDMDRDEQRIRQQLGFVSGGLSYYPRKKLVQIAEATRRFYPSWDEKMYRSCLARFHLSEDKRISELSEGMKVKLQLALAMSHGARLLILDEPTSGLDPVSRDDLLELLRTLCEKDGVSILFSTHITSDLDTCADDVTYLQNGTLAASCKLAAFTAPWKKLTGQQSALTPELRDRLRGLRVHKGVFEALCPSSAPCPAGCREEGADLQTVMVYLEREVEEKCCC